MTVRIGIVGAGGMAAYHIQGFRSAGAEIVAAADQNPARAKALAKDWNIGKTYSDVEGMLNAETLDAVSVITPNKFHCPLVLTALRRGVHVFCEKPPALNAAEMMQMRDGAEAAGRTLMFNFNNRARPESFAMMEYLRNGEAGTINSCQAVWKRRTGIPGFGGWFTTRALSGGGPVIDLLHMIDLGLYFMGYPEPEYVLAQTFHNFIHDKSFKGPWGIPDVADGVTDVECACHGFVRFQTGQVMFLQNSWAEMIRQEEISVVFQGTRAGGMVQRKFGIDGDDSTAVDRCELYVQEHGHSVNRSIVVPRDEAMGRIRSAANFVLTLEGKERALNTPDQAVRLMKLIDALYASAQSGKPVKVN